jgi:hypothetical protein
MDTLGAMMDPTLTRLLDVLAELDDNVLFGCYGINRGSDAPLDAALFAWRDAGAPRPGSSLAAPPVSAQPKAGDRVTVENVARCPIGTRVWWDLDGDRIEAERIDPDAWASVGMDNLTDHELTEPEPAPPAFILSLPSPLPTTEKR